MNNLKKVLSKLFKDFELKLYKKYTLKSELDDLKNGNLSTLGTIQSNVLGEDANYADVVFYNTITKSLEITTYKGGYYSYLIPVGIVVVPASHDIYGDGSVAMMSLKEMDPTNPESGKTTVANCLQWGGNSYNTSIPDYGAKTVPAYGTVTSKSETVTGFTNAVYLPSDRWKTATSTRVSTSSSSDYYAGILANSNTIGPSVYLEDGSANPQLLATTYNGTTYSNAFLDVDGKGNTSILQGLATAEDWLNNDTITNTSDQLYYPAACVCGRYKTDGTNSGDWYLPAFRELIYVYARIRSINKTISLLKSNYGSSIGVLVSDTTSYLSSTEYDASNARLINMANGNASRGSKASNYSVRAMYRITLKESLENLIAKLTARIAELENANLN